MKLIDIILDPQILITVYEHLKSKLGDIKPKKNIKKKSLEEMSMKWIYSTSEKLKEVFLISTFQTHPSTKTR
jgi:hypothetical protein